MLYSLGLDDLILIKNTVFKDDRGAFTEVYNDTYRWIMPEIVQISHSHNKGNVVRGLHLQLHPPMAKVMRVIRGSATIFNVDVRSVQKPAWVGITLTENDPYAVYAPSYFARGFITHDDHTVIEYFHDAVFDPTHTYTIAWNDPLLNIPWRIDNPHQADNLILSKKDANGMPFSTFCVRNDIPHHLYADASPRHVAKDILPLFTEKPLIYPS